MLLSEPIHVANPDEFITVARDKPPPININAPQGIFWATCQSINLFLLGLLEGIINKKIAAIIAIVESFSAPAGITPSNAVESHFLDIHKEAVIINTIPTIISSCEIFPNSLILSFITLSFIDVFEPKGKHKNVSIIQVIGRSIIEVGNPIFNQSTKFIS